MYCRCQEGDVHASCVSVSVCVCDVVTTSRTEYLLRCATVDTLVSIQDSMQWLEQQQHSVESLE